MDHATDYDATLQPGEQEAALDCGCLLYRHPDDGAPTLKFCEMHDQAERMTKSHAKILQLWSLLYDFDADDWKELDSCADAIDEIVQILHGEKPTREEMIAWHHADDPHCTCSACPPAGEEA